MYRDTVQFVNHIGWYSISSQAVRAHATGMDKIVDKPSSSAHVGRPESTTRKGGIQVINRAARILRTLADEPEGLSLGGIAERISLPRSTVQRIVSALADEGLVTAASVSARVRLGPGLLELAPRSPLNMVEIAHPFLKALSTETGETIDLALLRGDHIVFVDQVVGDHRLRAVSAVGERFPLHSTASGKACLALLNDAEILEKIGEALASMEGDGLRLDQFFAEITEIRRTGLAYDEEQHSLGISAVGVAMQDRQGDIYAVSIPAPTARARTDRQRNEQLLLQLRDELRNIEHGCETVHFPTGTARNARS